eukprot:16610-Heterococcus_DN1.PRE.5
MHNTIACTSSSQHSTTVTCDVVLLCNHSAAARRQYHTDYTLQQLTHLGTAQLMPNQLGNVQEALRRRTAVTQHGTVQDYSGKL